MQKVMFPEVQAIAELHQGNAEKALEALKPAEPFEAVNGGLLYARATAYLRSGRPTDAVPVYQKALGLKIVRLAGPQPDFVLAQLGLGRAYAAQGDKARARTAYQDLFGIWKDADADLPLLQQAKAEYAKLQ